MDITVDDDSIRFSKHNYDHVTLHILGHMFPNTEHYYDQICLAARVEIQLPGFNVDIIDDIQSDELDRFYDDLNSIYQTLKGRATFTTIHNWLQLDVFLNKFGHAFLEGFVTKNEAGIPVNKLNFQLELGDQTHLAVILNQLYKVTRKYHVKE